MKEKLSIGLKNFIVIGIIFALTICLIRVDEYLLTNSRIESSTTLSLQGLLFDLLFSVSLSGLVVIIHLAVSAITPRVASFISIVLFSVFVLFSFSLVQYFSVTLIPLSADLFGYSLRDIKTVLGSSGGTNFSTYLLLLFTLSFFISTSIIALKKELGQNIGNNPSIFIGSGMFVLFLFPIKPKAESFKRDVDYYCVTNKTDFFISRCWDYLTDEPEEIFGKNEYPFLHAVAYNNNLSNYFQFETERPTIVYLIVEGLGRDFVGADSQFKGFTPFLDSLSQKSLYWPNALSNAGRTFGALPSLLGSLPYGRDGFMSYVANAPAHQSLISLLKPYGYYTNFFYGGNTNFDNMDLFLENERIDYLLDESKFSVSYKKMKLNAEGFSWGFADKDLFSQANEIILQEKQSPRLDIYLTLSTHEPFQVPDEKIFATVDQILKSENKLQDENYLRYKNIFSCLLYTDQAIKKLLAEYAKLTDYKNTIFIITGDHRLIPIPPRSKLSRFHVPLLIYSPLLKKPETFKSIVTHSSVAPSLLALLKNYGLHFPSDMPFISDSLSTDNNFSSRADVALIRNKNETIDYIEGTHFLSEGRLYKIQPDLDLETDDDSETKNRLIKKLKHFKAKSIYALENNRLDKSSITQNPNNFTFTTSEENYIKGNHLKDISADELYTKARTLAFDKDYANSSIVSRCLLNQSPNYHDARVLLARTFAWQKQYDTAVYFLHQVLARNPKYADAYNALADIEYWKGNNINSLEFAKQGLEKNHDDLELMAREARALTLLGKKKEAKKIVEKILLSNARQEMAIELQKQLQ